MRVFSNTHLHPSPLHPSVLYLFFFFFPAILSFFVRSCCVGSKALFHWLFSGRLFTP